MALRGPEDEAPWPAPPPPPRRGRAPGALVLLLLLGSCLPWWGGCAGAAWSPLASGFAPPGTAAAAMAVELELAGLLPAASGEGRLWLRLMPEDSGVAQECTLEWTRSPDGAVRVYPVGMPGVPAGEAVFAPLHPARWRLDTFVVRGRLDAPGSGTPQLLSIAGQFAHRPVTLVAGELRDLGRLWLRVGTDRSFVYEMGSRGAPGALEQLALVPQLRGLRPVPQQPAAGAARPAPAGLVSGGAASAGASPREPGARGAAAAGGGGSPPAEPPAGTPEGTAAGDAPAGGALAAPPGGEAVLGVRLEVQRGLLPGERAAGVVRLLFRRLAGREVKALELGWEARAGGEPARLFMPGAQPFGPQQLLVPLGLGPGAYELSAVALEGRADGSAGRRLLQAQAVLAVPPVFEIAPGQCVDLGTLLPVYEGAGQLRLEFGGPSGPAAARQRALRDIAQASSPGPAPLHLVERALAAP
ncbi:MAG: hypothetical protein KatS3mg102_2376 [Planctomycetota bacterium]|nr:MAG: hypothetical protein KatS3mg102_2376 [Planctomycetota bacterium]